MFCPPNIKVALPSTEPELDFLSSAGSEADLVRIGAAGGTLFAAGDIAGSAGFAFVAAGVGSAGLVTESPGVVTLAPVGDLAAAGV